MSGGRGISVWLIRVGSHRVRVRVWILGRRQLLWLQSGDLGLDRAKAVQAKALALQEAYSNLEQHLAEILGVLSVVVLVAQHMVAPLEERTPALNVPTPCRLRSSDLERARMGGRIPDTVGLLLAWDLVHEPLTLILVALPD